MKAAKRYMAQDEHQKLGISLFYATWDLTGQEDRTNARDLEIIHAALIRGKRSLELCLEIGIQDFDLAFGYEGIARACPALGNAAEMKQAKDDALAANEGIARKDDCDNALGEINIIGG